MVSHLWAAFTKNAIRLCFNPALWESFCSEGISHESQPTVYKTPERQHTWLMFSRGEMRRHIQRWREGMSGIPWVQVSIATTQTNNTSTSWQHLDLDQRCDPPLEATRNGSLLHPVTTSNVWGETWEIQGFSSSVAPGCCGLYDVNKDSFYSAPQVERNLLAASEGVNFLKKERKTYTELLIHLFCSGFVN